MKFVRNGWANEEGRMMMEGKEREEKQKQRHNPPPPPPHPPKTGKKREKRKQLSINEPSNTAMYVSTPLPPWSMKKAVWFVFYKKEPETNCVRNTRDVCVHFVLLTLSIFLYFILCIAWLAYVSYLIRTSSFCAPVVVLLHCKAFEPKVSGGIAL